MRAGLRKVLGRFGASEGGNAVVEGVMMLPVMLMAWLGLFAFWEGFSSRSAVQEAAFVAADLLSREVVPVSDAFLDGLDNTVEYLVGQRFNVSTRFTSFSRTGTLDTDVAVNWSYSPGSAMAAMTSAQLVAKAAQLPKLAVGSTAIISETTMAYSTPFSVPIASYVVPASFSDMVVLRPRFLAKVCRAGIAC